MSTNPSSALIRPDDEIVDESSAGAVTVSRRELADLAAGLARTEALVAADTTPEPDGSDALERIADIAFVLHERDVEASLCDALDAAVRAISTAGARKEERARRTRQTAEVLRELLQRVTDMIALSEALHGKPSRTASAIKDDLPRAVVSRGGSLPSPAPAVGLASNLQCETDVVAAPPSEPVQRAKPLGRQGASAVNEAGGAVELRSSAAAAVMLSVEPASDAFLDEDLLLPTTANETAIPNRPVLNEVLSSEAPSGEVRPSRGLGSVSPTGAQGESSASKGVLLLLNPEDDPGDLFEPAAGMPPTAPPEPAIDTAAPPALENGLTPIPEQTGGAAAGITKFEHNVSAPLVVAEAGRLDVDSPVESSNPPRPLRAAAVTVPPAPRPDPTDPLAPIRALSEEEVIALFS
jgi:hypothetical protein